MELSRLSPSGTQYEPRAHFIQLHHHADYCVESNPMGNGVCVRHNRNGDSLEWPVRKIWQPPCLN